MADKNFKVKNSIISPTPIALTEGGTGQTSANNALNALLPLQTGNSNKFLKTDGTNTSWASPTATMSTLTIGTGLSGGSYDGSTPVTIANSGVLSINGSTGIITNIAVTNADNSFSANQTANSFTPSSSTKPTNGMFLPTTNAVGFSTNSVEQVRIDVNGDIWPITNATLTSANIRYGDGTTTYAGIQGNYLSSTTGSLVLQTLKAGTLTTALTIDNTSTLTLNGTPYQNAGFVKTSSAGVLSVDTSAYITGSSPTITTPVIDSISASAATGINPSLYANTTTGNISIGAGLTTGQLNIATVGTGVTPISIGHTNATLAVTSSGTTLTTAGALTLSSTLQATTGTLTGSTLAINGASPTISSSNASAASIFTSTVTGITIGSSTATTTLYPAVGTTSTGVAGAGYMGMPQTLNPASPYTLQATDAGKHIYMTTSGGTITIPAATVTAFPLGTTIVIINGSAVTTTININTDTLQLANSASTGARTLAAFGMATLVKVAGLSSAGVWIISGNGLT